MCGTKWEGLVNSRRKRGFCTIKILIQDQPPGPSAGRIRCLTCLMKDAPAPTPPHTCDASHVCLRGVPVQVGGAHHRRHRTPGLPPGPCWRRTSPQRLWSPQSPSPRSCTSGSRGRSGGRVRPGRRPRPWQGPRPRRFSAFCWLWGPSLFGTRGLHGVVRCLVVRTDCTAAFDKAEQKGARWV